MITIDCSVVKGTRGKVAVLLIGMRRLCRNNFGHNRYMWESGIILAF